MSPPVGVSRILSQPIPAPHHVNLSPLFCPALLYSAASNPIESPRVPSKPTLCRPTTTPVCNVFNLDGMNCAVDAACASSLIAVKVAIDELLYGDCDTMIAGATCTDCSIGMYMAFSKTPVFSTKQSVRLAPLHAILDFTPCRGHFRSFF